MSLSFRLTEERFNRIRPLLPNKSRGAPRVDDRRVLSGIVFRLQRGCRRSDGPGEYGPAKTLYNRYKRRSETGVFERIFEALAREGADPDTLTIDAGHIETHRIAANGVKKQRRRARRRQDRRRAKSQAASGMRRPGAPGSLTSDCGQSRRYRLGASIP